MKFTSILAQLIMEDSRYEVLKSKFATEKEKNGKVIPPKVRPSNELSSIEVFDEIVKADPTTVVEGDEIKKTGKYTQWLLKQYMKLQPNVEYGSEEFDSQLTSMQDRFIEDLYKVKTDLQKFDRFKNNIDEDKRDINKLDIATLYDLVKDFKLTNKATKEDKKEAASTYEFKGSKVIYRGSNWTVVEIKGTDEENIKAAHFFGGNHMEPSQGETRWCTSSPGLNYAYSHLKDGPLYVVIPNQPRAFSSDKTVGDVSGLPALRYQFHFETNQYMDPADRRVDIVKMLSDGGEMSELREVFKPMFQKTFTNKKGSSSEFKLRLPDDSNSHYFALFGFDKLTELIPEDVEHIDVTNKSGNIDLELPDDFFNNYKKLEGVYFENCISELPSSIGQCKDLQLLALINNKNLTKLPESVCQCDELYICNLTGSDNVEIPQCLIERSESGEGLFIQQ